MATLKDFRDERIRKLDELKKKGINPYPSDSYRTHTTHDVKDRFNDLEGRNVTVAGRIMNIRKFGKIAFIVIRDYNGHLQLFIQDSILNDSEITKNQISIKEVSLLDSGDFIEASGKVIKTKSGEISIEEVRKDYEVIKILNRNKL